MRRDANRRGRQVVRGEEPKGFGDTLKTGFGAVLDLTKSAWADLLHSQANASEYVLQNDHFDVVRPGSVKTVEYKRVQRAVKSGDRVTLHLDRGTVLIKPYAHVVAGRVKVPIGWARNGLEVPYELLIDELCARCGVELEAV